MQRQQGLELFGTGCAGRLMSRKEAFERFSMDIFWAEMDGAWPLAAF
jgi:hypothetical protein